MTEPELKPCPDCNGNCSEYPSDGLENCITCKGKGLTESKLKPLPCPFCGCKAEVYVNGGADCCCVRCRGCDAIGKTFYFDTESDDYELGCSSQYEKKAIEAWNKRTDKEFGIGFDAAIEMIIDSLDQYDSNELATMSVWSFIEKLKDDIVEEAEAYKNDK